MSNLLEKASILTTPTAYNNGKILSVKGGTPADLDFTRGSTATRVNSSGLIEDVASGLPRIDYTDGVGSILLESQSTNILEYSSNFSKSVWFKQSGIAPTYNTTETLSPDGTYNATKFIGNGSAGVYSIGSAVGVTSRTVYLKSIIGTVNIILKDPTRTVSSKTVTVTTEWQRFDLIEDNGHSSSSGIWVSNIPVSGVYMWGAQVEQQSYATSYIPTAGTIQTRLAEAASNAGSSDLINSTEGVLYVNVKMPSSIVNNHWLTISDGTNQNSISIVFESTGKTTGRTEVGGANQFYQQHISDYSIYQKIAVCWKLNEFKMFVNGVQIGSTDTSGLVPSVGSLSQLQFAYSTNSSNFLFSKCKGLAVFKEALTDEELTCLTTI